MDPATLLIAVLAAGVGPLTTSGPWDPINTVVSAMVLVILWAYILSGRSSFTAPEILANAVIIGFISGIGLAWPIQELFGWHSNPYRTSIGALIIGAVIAAALFLWQLRKLDRAAGPDENIELARKSG